MATPGPCTTRASTPPVSFSPAWPGPRDDEGIRDCFPSACLGRRRRTGADHARPGGAAHRDPFAADRAAAWERARRISGGRAQPGAGAHRHPAHRWHHGRQAADHRLRSNARLSSPAACHRSPRARGFPRLRRNRLYPAHQVQRGELASGGPGSGTRLGPGYRFNFGPGSVTPYASVGVSRIWGEFHVTSDNSVLTSTTINPGITGGVRLLSKLGLEVVAELVVFPERLVHPSFGLAWVFDLSSKR